MYEVVLFDLDGTLTDPGVGITNSVAYALNKYGIEVTDRSELYKFIGPPLQESFEHYYGFSKEKAQEAVAYYREYYREKGIFENLVYEGIEELLKAISNSGKQIIVATSKPEEFAKKILEHFDLAKYFTYIAGSNMDGTRTKKAEVISYALETCNITDYSKVVMIGDREHDVIGANKVGVASIGVLFGYGDYAELKAAGASYIVETVEDMYPILFEEKKGSEKWLQWAVELQSIAQGALYYCENEYDIERFERIREIAAEMIQYKTDIPMDKVKDLFCNETGYQTPKIDSRAAIFKEGKILLVKEKNGTWSLPGGWVDVDLSVKENIIKEVKEEAGLDVTADKVIAVQDREKHNLPVYAYKVCKIFILCTVIGGAFQKNIETVESRYFGMEELPLLATEKNNAEQIAMCFKAYEAENWETVLD